MPSYIPQQIPLQQPIDDGYYSGNKSVEQIEGEGEGLLNPSNKETNEYQNV